MRWDLKTADSLTGERLAAELSSQPSLQLKKSEIASTLARLLVMRGITEGAAAEHFLAPSLSHLHSPYLMTGMQAAVNRIEAAIENKESILIYGDYDVDGTTGSLFSKLLLSYAVAPRIFTFPIASGTATTCATT